MTEKDKNPMKSWWETQEQMLNLWKDSMEKMSSAQGMDFLGETGKDMIKNLMESQKKMIDMWGKPFAQFQPQQMADMFSPQGQEAWQGWWNMQQKMFNFWKDAMQTMQPGMSSELFGMKDWSLPFGNMYQEMMKGSASGYQEFMKLIPTGVGRETFEKMTQASQVYTNMMSFWENIADNLPGKDDVEKWKEFSNTWLENYNKVLDDFFSLNLPEPFRSLMKTPAEMTELYQEVFFNFLQPWVDVSDQLQEKYTQAMKGDRDAYMDFLRLWHETYQNSYGKVLRVPALGLSRESFEKISGSIDSFMQYLASSNKFSASLYKTGQEVMEQLMKRIAELAEKGEAPSTFSEFYQLWWHSNEEAYFELFKTESFSKMLGEAVDSWVRFKKHYDDLVDDFVSQNLPVPTEKEMDSLYKTVYQMRKTIKEQGKQIQELSAQIEGKSAEGGASA